ncbi:hypothetical protein F2P81_026372 [Scophthalmus maximus]|uniref:Cyclic nucleotide-binding domain-containing protein n=1 Tax=Scophthalmus maximus TaxID=52904 RepID=A0A6A4RM26_SCOMX|nr:hypothetical protein F2P81_026372 [Scophthalmus maximus]
MSRSESRDRRSPQSRRPSTRRSSLTSRSPATAKPKSESCSTDAAQTHTLTRNEPSDVHLCVCRSNDLIQRALMDNDFMKHLEHGQILTIMECMRPTSLSRGCCVIQEGDDGSEVYVLEGETDRCPLETEHQNFYN